jgi:hypothetical protein
MLSIAIFQGKYELSIGKYSKRLSVIDIDNLPEFDKKNASSIN